MDNASSVKTIDRLVHVLDCFSQDRPAWTLAELSGELRLPKSTLHRFLVGLETHGILRRDESDKRWRLGYHLFIWGSVAAQSTTLRDLARPTMCRLVRESGETALLTVYQDREVVCIDKCETSHPVRLALEVGSRRWPHAGASSKALMAYLPEEEIEAILREKGLPKICKNTITEAEALRADLAKIRAQGYAVSLEETDYGAWGVATPIRNWLGQVVGAIGLAGPTMRHNHAKVRDYVLLCRKAADDISASLTREGSPHAAPGRLSE